ncbi:MAG: hypothetical protein JKY51_03965 [Opitutaceae bacterium]|nr:hypothetical protein [Opitutaceae bacterium]
MELHLQSLSSTCHVTGEAFLEGEQLLCCLVEEESGEVARIDLKASAEESFTSDREILCRWYLTYVTKEPAGSEERALKLTAENLFIELCDSGSDEESENAQLLQFLGLMLERKRILRNRGVSKDGAWQAYYHIKSKKDYKIPAGDLSTRFFIEIQSKLGLLLGPNEADEEGAEKKQEEKSEAANPAL